MGARSESKAQKAIEDLYRDNPNLENDSVQFLKLDLASIKNVVAAADEIKRTESRLDILGGYSSN
jgi:NAD(P)-dependent dehydrogenase (short-subunit alcohol dehydrogenase family)